MGYDLRNTHGMCICIRTYAMRMYTLARYRKLCGKVTIAYLTSGGYIERGGEDGHRPHLLAYLNPNIIIHHQHIFFYVNLQYLVVTKFGAYLPLFNMMKM